MQQEQAIDMLTHPFFDTAGRIQWADLGCGTGTFTLALAHLLPPQSSITAMDTNKKALARIPDRYRETSIEKINGDFVKHTLPFTGLHGILIANALHFVKDQPAFIRKVQNSLAADGCFLIVEYDTDKSNPWVPYPVSFRALQKLFANAGYPSVKKLNEMPSVYNAAMIYAAIIEQ